LSQFVEEQDNPQYYGLLREFKRVTGFGVLINTSFNLHGRTIVRTADDAITDFLDRGIDELYLEGYRITRAASADPQA
jgi:carbamoyltransferase